MFRELPHADTDEPPHMLAINTTPLIDVLLVLVVMLIITVPAQLHAIHMALPAAPDRTAADTAAPVAIGVDAQARIRWNGELVSQAQLEARLEQAARAPQVPAIHIRMHQAAAYGAFVQVLAATRAHGLSRVAIVGLERSSP